jgi:hypothetical protein
MESVADFKEEYQPQSLERLKASIRTRISIWVRASGIWGVGALTYFVQKADLRAREYSGADHHSGEIKLAGKSKQLKDSGGLLSLSVRTSRSDRNQTVATVFEIVAFYTHREAPKST